MTPTVQVDRSIYIAATAKIQIDADGCVLGGFVRISKAATISDGVIIAQYGGSVEIGAHVYIGLIASFMGMGALRLVETR